MFQLVCVCVCVCTCVLRVCVSGQIGDVQLGESGVSPE